MSVSGLKGVLANSKSTDNLAKQRLAENSSSHQRANTRKLLTKRSNAVFKDPLPPVAETKSTTVKHTIPRSSDAAKQESSGFPSTAPSQRQNNANSAEIPQTGIEQSKSSHEPSGLDVPEQCPALSSDTTYVDDTANSEDVEDVKENQKPNAHSTTSSAAELPSLPESRGLRKSDGQMPRDLIDLAHARSDQGPAPSEPEEYWDDEDDDNDEDDGYATARSYRSRGDNTTGGTTTVLFPKYNQKVKRELEMAKQIVEATRTKEDIEDEYWDTSMVAEYSDEIFEYMRELEVTTTTLSFPPRRMLTILDSSRCCPTLTTWTTKQRSSGRCGLFSWIGWSKFTTDSHSFQRHCFFASITSIAFFPAKLCLSASCS